MAGDTRINDRVALTREPVQVQPCVGHLACVGTFKSMARFDSRNAYIPGEHASSNHGHSLGQRRIALHRGILSDVPRSIGTGASKYSRLLP